MTEPQFDRFNHNEVEAGRAMPLDEVRKLLGVPTKIELETVKIPNPLRIRWWQFRFRYQMWKQERRLDKLVQRKIIEEMNAALENQAIYGDGPWNPKS